MNSEIFSIILKSSSWLSLNQQLAKLTKNKKNKLAGDIFEYLVKFFLKTAPHYKTKLKNVYLLNETPSHIKNFLNLPNSDEGIDIIAETFENDYWAVQCKYRSNENDTLNIKGDLSTFNNLAFNYCKNISHGIICTTASRPPKKNKYLKKVGFELLDTWISLDENNLFKAIKLKLNGKIFRPTIIKPKKHQIQAINNAKKYFKKKDRGKIIMPCGTGKSLTAFWITKELKSKKILIAVPSLALLQQTLKVWTREFVNNKINADWFCVCSDTTVKENQDELVNSTADLGIKVDTDPKKIRNFLARKNNKIKILFTTYQSGKATSIGSKKIKFDFGIMDEAHKTVGSDKKLMAFLLDEKNIRISKRLFMTATERVFRGDKENYVSMDDPKNYGEMIYELSFKKAINAKPAIIADYKVLTFEIYEKDIINLYESNKFLQIKKDLKNISARELATALALRKAIKNLKIKNAISFHRSIERAKNFRNQQDLITKVYPHYKKINSYHVRGDMPTSQRTIQMKLFEKNKGLMTNARCLTEGVDLPAIDCVCFTDPKKSKIDIVQAAGRALRLSKNKKFGYILIPIYIPKNQSPNDAAKDQGFEEISNTVRALGDSDKRIVEHLRSISQGKIPKSGSPIDGITNLKVLEKIDSERFNNSIKLKIWDRIAFFNFDTYENAKKRIFEAGIYTYNGLRNWKERPKDIPYHPERTYKNKGWINSTEFFNNLSSKYNIDWLPIDEAKKIIKPYNIKGLDHWNKWKKKNRNILPINFPLNPQVAYAKLGVWLSYGDFFGNKNIATKNLYKDLSFDQVKTYLKRFNIKSQSHYESLLKAGKIKGLPKDLRPRYKNDKNFISIPDLLGCPMQEKKKFISERKMFSKTKAFSLKKIKMYIKENKLRNFDDLKVKVKEDKLWLNIPLSVSSYLILFPNEWKGAKDLFGLPRFHQRLEFANFKEAKDILKVFKFKNVGEYFKKRKKLSTNKKPLPSKPEIIYKKDWKGWGDFLSNGNIRTDTIIGRRRRNGRNWK